MFTVELDAPGPGAVRLRLQGHLDSAAALELLHRAAVVVRCGCAHLVVDLDGLTGFDRQAAYAVTGCAKLSRFVPEGVAVVAGADAARDLAEAAGVRALAGRAH